jgi:hypothetical protein
MTPLDDEIVNLGNAANGVDLERIAFHLWLRDIQSKIDSLPQALQHEFCIRLMVRYFCNTKENQ